VNWQQSFTLMILWKRKSCISEYMFNIIYEFDVPFRFEMRNLSTKLYQGLVKTRKYLTYPLIDRLIRLALTLHVSTATIVRSFSTINILKNRPRNNMGDECLADCLITYIERGIVEKFDTYSTIDEFYDMKE